MTCKLLTPKAGTKTMSSFLAVDREPALVIVACSEPGIGGILVTSCVTAVDAFPWSGWTFATTI